MAPVAQKVSAAIRLHKKEDRAAMSESDRQDFYAEATKKHLPKFKVLSAKLNQSESTSTTDSTLTDDATLTQLITSTKQRHHQYDMTDVFEIVFPVDPLNSPALKLDASGRPVTLDLYTMYTQVTVQQVAISCYWYLTWVNQIDHPWIRENLMLTHLYFCNHTTVDLHNKVLESFSKFEVGYQGGPLYFKLMMETLVSNSESLSTALVQSLKAYKINAIPGEDVSKAVTLLRSGIDRLFWVHRLPLNIVEILFTVYQTSSVPTFNEIFHNLAVQHQIQQHSPSGLWQSATSTGHFVPQWNVLLNDPQSIVDRQKLLKESCDNLHSLAEKTYTNHLTLGTWLVVKQNANAFILKANTLLAGACWNCGDTDCTVSKCPHPKNEKKIAANRDAFKKAKQAKAKNKNSSPKSSGTSSNDSGTPSDNGDFKAPNRGESNRRVIKGTPMVYSHAKKRWFRDTRAHLTEANDPSDQEGKQSKTTSTSPTDEGTSTKPNKQEAVNTALTEATKHIGQIFLGLEKTLKEE